MNANEPNDSQANGAAANRHFRVPRACFAGASEAAKQRRKIDALLREGDDSILDEGDLHIDAKRKTRVFDPRRTWAGLATAALTWGVFGLVTGGWESLGIWALLGAAGVGVWAYANEHLLTKGESVRRGRSMPPSTSTVIAWADGSVASRDRDLGLGQFGPAHAVVHAHRNWRTARGVTDRTTRRSRRPAGGHTLNRRPRRTFSPTRTPPRGPAR